MEISKIIYLLEEALNSQVEKVDAMGRSHAAERSTLANDLKSLANLVQKHSAPQLAESPIKSDTLS